MDYNSNSDNTNDQPQQQQPFQSSDPDFQKMQQQPTGYDPTTGGPIYSQPQQDQQNQQYYYQQQPYQQSVYQQAYQQQPYQQQVYTQGNGLEEPVSLGEWMLTMLVMCIPLVNIIMTFVWAFSSSAKKSKSNYFKASLIWALIGIAVTIVMCVLMFMHPIYW